MRLPALLVHLSLLLVAAGGCATWLGGESRRVRLTPGVPAEAGLSQPLLLDSFVTVTYPASDLPRDYVSYLHLGDAPLTVSVNSPAEAEGYTLRQDACDTLGRSTIELSRDTWGTGLVYAGYILFMAGGIGLLVDPRGRFRRLIAPVLALCVAQGIAAAPLPGPGEDDARAMRTRPVMWRGRIAPMNTAAREFCREVCGTVSPGGQSAERVMASLVLFPDEWREARIITVGARLAGSLGLPGRHASVADLYGADGGYRLRAFYGINPELDEEVLEADSRRELIEALQAGELLRPVTDDVGATTLLRLKIETFYNTVPFAEIFFAVAIIAGAAGFLPRVRPILRPTAWVLMLWQGTGWALRWIVKGSIPLGNGGETLIFLSVALLGIGLVACRRQPLLPAGAVLAAGFAGLGGWIDLRHAPLLPLMPVLHSPWLSVHVTLVMLAYALLALTFVASVTALVRPAQGAGLRRFDMALLYPAVVLLGAGIITGSVWAQTSWGRYWSWDPKETWALVTMAVYAVPFHRMGGLLRTPRRFHLFVALAFLSVLFTYFGVNYLNSVHAYK